MDKKPITNPKFIWKEGDLTILNEETLPEVESFLNQQAKEMREQEIKEIEDEIKELDSRISSLKSEIKELDKELKKTT